MKMLIFTVGVGIGFLSAIVWAVTSVATVDAS